MEADAGSRFRPASWWRAHARAVLLGGSSIEIVRLGWSSTVSGMSLRSRVFTAGVVHCGTSTLQGSARVFLREKEKTKKQKQTQRAQHMPRFQYSSSRATAGVHTPQSNDSMRRTGSPSSRSKVVDRCRRGVEALVTPQSKTSNTYAPARAQ